ncbi:bifunctional biotin--[acetyl-CoA-carboxylase] ligase/biotin operon repressor BirA [Vibrio genomosp. F10]|uniref:Bifunctional ligase/repressor BirA n=2 Tax=Vibrio genomosp. F10 TaxID=723171 RepID=A0A1B9R088_9VIBR|nr:bifunctional biotin--[acetyl-CoA-carboxylase] ligase/biotin operon repressor BirA [Vibrio genomosp. F10]OCH77290.1 biotin--[acetyl-CoA-carboxylase] ligase [Vibrio genomosp. F10]OEE33155.1 biotin--[acetyl-CoA-carboxylase] ligase [Vibrio genomosp. F10 str. ZF-129]OEE95656.1 biotin--[acetyl-CoA-carboxylase] ligase [Vibrio genomosp. F10 str. 9ZC157]OEF01094.1 biotin--[acetyl-CoA-carboxylase] ligase [Vibrio genomosp. F10 str. 9ZD137]OEF06207.1 biotin--[acetyl-CoA-carboxylase] ligase [Vibrio geno
MKEHRVKLAILQTLSQGGFHSGQELGEQLGISRAAISKHIKGIQAWGVDVFSVQGKGYQLSKPMQLLDEALLKSQVTTPLELVPIIDSTNQYLLDRVDQLESGSVCIAEYQAKGRGRRGREWVSPFGSNLYLSIYWRLDAGMAAAMGLSLVVGVAIVEALEKIGIDGVKLKWPNDLYFEDKKLAGILVEMSGQAGAAANLVIGMGINLNMANDSQNINQNVTQKITQPWVSLSEVCDAQPHPQTFDRNDLAVTLVNTLQSTLNDYELYGMTGFVERWNRLDNYLGRKVKLVMGSREIEGISKGIDAQGAVLLETDQGVERFIGGEISLRNNETP